MTGDPPFRGLDFRAPPLDGAELDRVVAHLRAGGLVAYPTETVYGFGCALIPEALDRLRELKARDEERPFLLLVPDRDTVDDLEWTSEADEMARVFWPGALTLVLADPGRAYPGHVRGPDGAVAVRVSPHPLVRAIMERLGAPLTSTSANLPGEPPASDAGAAARAALAAGAGPDELWVLDGGRLEASPPSTIVDVTRGSPRVLRAGAVPPGRLACIQVE